MAQRQNPQSSFYHGLALDFRPFDEAKLDDIIERTGLAPVVEAGPARDKLRERMNTAAILLNHDLQIARSPSAKADSSALQSLVSPIHRLRVLLPVSVDRDHGLAPGNELRIADGLLRLLGPKMTARLRGDTPIANWTWHLAPPPDHEESPHRRSGDEPEVSSDDIDGGWSSDRQIAPYDPADAASYFGADNPNDILVCLGNILALLEDAARAAQADCAEAPAAARASPEKHFVFALIDIYRDLFDRSPGTSYDPLKGKRGGPLIRFLTACLTEVAPCGAHQIKADTLKQFADEYRAKTPSD
jgi:hypothetical protein